jgi:hypothetical protein
MSIIAICIKELSELEKGNMIHLDPYTGAVTITGE